MHATTPFTVLAAAGLASAAVLPRDSTDAQGCLMEDSNQYCQAVGVVDYLDLGGAGSYPEVIDMNQDTGKCTKQNTSYSGPLAPFDEPLSIHFRGPLLLNQVAVYRVSNGANKVKRWIRGSAREAPEEIHQPLDKRSTPDQSTKEVKVVTDVVTEWTTITVTIDEDGEAVTSSPIPPTATSNAVASSNISATSMTETQATASPKPSTTVPSTSTRSSQGSVSQSATGAPASNNPITGPNSGGSGSGTGTGTGTPTENSRIAYYNADDQHLDGMVFLGNYGGEGSGIAGKFGASLSYINSNATGGAANATILEKSVIPSEHEFALFTDEPCDSTCGFSQPGSVAHKGFETADTVFLFEFRMPHDNTSWATGTQGNMPAIWFLNSKVPRTAQYNECNCWSGCGELDLFEILGDENGAEEKLIATVHKDLGTGDTNYFPRPSESTVVGAAAFDTEQNRVVIKLLSDDWLGGFPASLNGEQITEIYSNKSSIQGLGSNSRNVLG